MEPMEPKVCKLDGLFQLSYALPHRILVAQAYPLRSPNGSTIIVYGHDSGLSLVWRGGLPLKSRAESEKPAHPKLNGATSDEPMTIDDSEDDEAPGESKRAYNDSAEFEQQELEFDSSRAYEQVIQTLDLPLRTKVLQLSFLPLPPELQQSSLGALPPLLLEKLVVSVACSDYSVRVLTIPLTPPSHRLKSNALGALAGKGIYGEQMLILPLSNGHRNYPRGVSMTLASHSTASGDHAEGSDYEDKIWDVLVASHSADVSGLLLIHRISLAGGNGLDMEVSASRQPWRSQYLASPAKVISFNTSIYPARRHSQLLVAEGKGAVRIFDCLPQPDVDRGSWLISLYSDFEASASKIPRRKELLSAHWVLGGKAIAALLADGEWGIWDLENRVPYKKTTDGWQAAPGIFLANFTIAGYIGNLPAAKTGTSKSSTSTEPKSQLAPMTPGTRKIRQEKLFTGPAGKNSGPARGGISSFSASDGSNSRKDDVTLLIWHGKLITTIPSLLTYWQNKVKGSGNLFGNGAQGQPKEINTIHQGEEIRNEASLIPTHNSTSGSMKPSNNSSMLVVGEHRIIIICPPLLEPWSPATAPESRKPTRSTAADQAMLTRGELDVDGIDNVLTSMSNGQHLNGAQGKTRYPRKQAKHLIA